MKIAIVILAALVIGFIVIQVRAKQSQNDIETYPYQVVKTYDDIEVRKYEPSLFSSVKLPISDYKSGSSRGFSVLAGYIFGGNDRNEKIAMTSPVAMSMEDSMTVMFMVPRKYSKESLPKPNQSNIDIVEMPQKTMAAITFGGWANDDKIAQYKEALIATLDKAGLKHTNKFYFFGYNPPYEVTNRKNEVLVELVEGQVP